MVDDPSSYLCFLVHPASVELRVQVCWLLGFGNSLLLTAAFSTPYPPMHPPRRNLTRTASRPRSEQ